MANYPNGSDDLDESVLVVGHDDLDRPDDPEESDDSDRLDEFDGSET